MQSDEREGHWHCPKSVCGISWDCWGWTWTLERPQTYQLSYKQHQPQRPPSSWPTPTVATTPMDSVKFRRSFDWRINQHLATLTLQSWTEVTEMGKEPLWSQRRGSCWCTEASWLLPPLCLPICQLSIFEVHNMRYLQPLSYNFFFSFSYFLCYSLDGFYWQVFTLTDFYFAVSNLPKSSFSGFFILFILFFQFCNFHLFCLYSFNFFFWFFFIITLSTQVWYFKVLIC